MTADVVLYAFDTMADWEYAHITTVLQIVARRGDDRFRLLTAGIPVAGICGATKAMARAGLCAHHAHTLDPEDAPTNYPGAAHRVDASAVHDGDLITAVGEAPLEFSRMVFQRLDLDTPEGIDEWYASFKDAPDARG